MRKTWGEESCIILMNVDTAAAQVDLSGYADWRLAASLCVDDVPVELSGNTLSLPPFALAVLLP